MRYKISELEDQLIATVEADTTNFSNVLVKPYSGQVSAQNFLNPEYMQGFVDLLPFVFVSYQGRFSEKMDRDSSLMYYIHTLFFRFYIGARSANTTQDAVRNCYDMLAGIYDDIHGKVPVTSPQQLTGYTPLSGTALTSTDATVRSCFYETGGRDEQLVVNLPGIVVYQSDYEIKMVA